MTSLTLQEIRRQPAAWQEAVQAVESGADELRRLLGAGPDLTVFTGCGSSYYLSIAAAGFYQEITGRPARAVPASELILSRGSHIPPGHRTALVAFSRSGTTTETIVAMEEHRRAGLGPSVAVVCRPGSPMADMGDLALVLPGADDQSVVMTSSVTSMLLAVLYTAAVVADDAALRARLQTLPTLLQERLPEQQELGRELGANLGLRQFIYLGLGPVFGLALEGMLKLKEMTQVPCEAYSPLEFRHGPISVAGPGTAVVLLGTDRADAQELEVLDDVRRFGAHTVWLTGSGAEPGAGAPRAAESGRPVPADQIYRTGGDLPDVARCLLYLPLLQLIAYHRAEALGRNPDLPRHLNQVVVLDPAGLTQ